MGDIVGSGTTCRSSDIQLLFQPSAKSFAAKRISRYKRQYC